MSCRLSRTVPPIKCAGCVLPQGWGAPIWPGTMLQEPDALRFASDATLFALWGGGLLLLAGIAMWAEIRRTRRKHIDKVGWMPWTKLFFVCALVGVTLIGLALKGG